MAWRLVKAHG